MIFLMSVIGFGQNRHLTIGYQNNGLCFGNSMSNNGLRFNLIDKNVKIINGVNITCISNSLNINGFSLGMVSNNDVNVNGILISGFSGESKIINGFVLSGLGHVAHKLNGVGIGGLAICGDTLNGLFISSIGISWWNTQKIKLINGFTIGVFIGANTEELNGISIGFLHNVIDELNGVEIALINRSKELHGFQFGLWNVAENNKTFKRMPIMNFNLKRKTSR